MEVFKSLWKPRGSIAIPNYDANDGVDLLVKSLLYMFKRLAIAKSGDKIERYAIDGMSNEDLANLDKMYNLAGFEHVAMHDPHRVLVDWPKNRFRAMQILAHMPQMEQLPELRERNFRFVVLEADASNDEYILTLSKSDIYAEHNLPLEIRREIAAAVLRRHRARNLETRAAIILEYLRLVATEIQVARIYKAMMGKISPGQSPAHSPSHSPSHSPTHSPIQSRSSSPSRFDRSPSPLRNKTSTSPRPPSPSRFPKVAPSTPNPKLTGGPKLSASQQSSPIHGSPHGSYLGSPHVSPSPSPPGSPTSPSASSTRPKVKPSQPNLKLAGSAPNLNANNVAPLVDAGKKHVLQQARLAVKARIDKEQRALGGNWIRY